MTQQLNQGDLFRESLLRGGLVKRINLATRTRQNRFPQPANLCPTPIHSVFAQLLRNAPRVRVRAGFP